MPRSGWVPTAFQIHNVDVIRAAFYENVIERQVTEIVVLGVEIDYCTSQHFESADRPGKGIPGPASVAQ